MKTAVRMLVAATLMLVVVAAVGHNRAIASPVAPGPAIAIKSPVAPGAATAALVGSPATPSPAR